MAEHIEVAGTESGAALFRLNGVLDFDSVPAIFSESITRFGAHSDIILDLSGVTRANSAGLALLLEWQRMAREPGKSVSIRNVPAALRNLAHVSELETLLSL